MGCKFAKNKPTRVANPPTMDNKLDNKLDNKVDLLKNNQWNFENIVFEGASTNGSAAIGAYKILDKVGIMKNIKKFSGTSSGAIMATLAAVRMPANVMEKHFLDVDLGSLKDDTCGLIRDINRIFEYFGFYKGDALLEWIEQMLYQHTNIKNITFRQIKEIYGSDLYITVANLNKVEVEYLNTYTSPNMKVSLAVRWSASLPLIFRALKNNKNEIMVDGGIGDNYPIDLFDFGKKYNKKTLGIKIMSPKVERKNNKIRQHLGFEINDIKDFLCATVIFLTSQQERQKIKKGYWERTIVLESSDRKVNDFDANIQDRQKDICTGMTNTIEALTYYANNNTFANLNC